MHWLSAHYLKNCVNHSVRENDSLTKITPASRLSGTPTSIFAVMTKLANENNAVNLSQGFPDFNCDPELIEIVREYMIEGNNQYAPMPGVPRLKQGLSNKINALYGIRPDPDKEITITAGATQAIFTIISTFVLPGDEVIIFEPAYDSYLPSVTAMGGIAKPVPLSPTNFSVDWNLFANSISTKTKMVIINTPHNPCGSLLTQDDLRILVDFSNKYGFLILSDEVYEHIIFDGVTHNSLLSFYNDCSNILAVFSFGKTYHTTGWKVGYIAAREALTSAFRNIHQFTVFAVNTPVQYAYADFLEDKDRYLSLSAFYQKKRDMLLQGMKDSAFKFTPSRGTYFQLLDYSDLSDMNDFEFAKLLVNQFNVAVIPLSPFYANGSDLRLIRVCFAKKEQTLQNGIERLLTAADHLLNRKATL